MATIYNKVKQYLELEPKARERSLRARGLVNLLLQDYTDFREIPKETVIAFCRDFESLNREWRAVTNDCEDLRGSDWEDKDELEQTEILNRGYEVGYKQDIKNARH